MPEHTQRPRQTDEYPHAIQHAGAFAMRVFDQVEQGLLDDGYTQEEADGLLMLNLRKILTRAEQVAQEEAAADQRRAANSANATTLNEGRKRRGGRGGGTGKDRGGSVGA